MKIRHYATGALAVNTYLAYDDGNNAFVVDPGGYDPRMIKDIEENHLDLKYIILTHGHCDHIGGIPKLVERFPNIIVVAHEDEMEMLGNSQMNSSAEFFGYPVTVEANLLVKDLDTLDIGDMHLEFIHTPGHSKGGMCIYAPKDQVCFSGDTLFRASVGRSDLYGGNWDVLASSIKNRLYKLPEDTLVLPGHMGETSIGFEKRYNPFVQDRNS